MTNSQATPDDKTVRLLAVPVKLAAAACISISVGGVLWSCLAKVPIYANGVAILMPTNQSKLFLSQASGTVVHFTDQPQHQNDQSRALYDFGSSNKELSSEELLALATYALNLGNKEASSPLIVASTKIIPNKSLLSMIDSDSAKASLRATILDAKLDLKSNEASKRELTYIDKKIRRKIALMQKQLGTENKFLLAIRKLNDKGYASEARLLDQESIVVGIENEIISLQDELESNQSKLIQLDVSSQESLTALLKALQNYIGSNLIFSTDNLSVADVIAPHLTEVKVNASILRANVNHKSLNHGVVIPGYVGDASVQRVMPEMKALLTPVGMSRAQYGGFYGVVESSSLLPQNEIEIVNQLGDPGVANEIFGQLKRPVLVKIKLQQSSDQSDPNKAGFVWSSQGKVPYPVREGDRLNLQITTQRIRPISLLIPWLKQVIGESPPMIQSNSSS
ncbi:hypothetical protein [Synechococcus sp. BS56D]|uniref:hypothetical protein n=1 Tax=Synechococcus sp. BS56D TaxID=2055944 RepID=UPI001040549E|nr:hypothetical protein [Synechococcus sp. BS56D]